MKRIWFDTEFIDTGRDLHLVSIGMVDDVGRTLYLESAEAPIHLADKWVSDHVLAQLEGRCATAREIKAEILSFVGWDAVEFWAYFGAWDWILLCRTIAGRLLDVPPNWPKLVLDVEQYRIHSGVTELPRQRNREHHALDDALWTRDAWTFLAGYTRG